MSILLAVLATAAGAGAGDGAAAAAKPRLPDSAVFKASVRGTQVTTWSLRRADDPDDPCDASQTGDGSQTIRFRTKTMQVRALEGGRGLPLPDAMFAPGILPADMDVEREGEYRTGASAPDCPAIAEGDDLAPLVGPDCGRRRGAGTVRLGLGHDAPSGELLSLGRNVMWMSGDVGSAISYDDCPWWVGGPAEGPSETELLPDWTAFAQRRLFDRRRRVLRVSGDFDQPYQADGFTGKTLTTWNLTLRRVR